MERYRYGNKVMYTKNYMKRKALEQFKKDEPDLKGKIKEVNYEKQYVVVEDITLPGYTIQYQF